MYFQLRAHGSYLTLGQCPEIQNFKWKPYLFLIIKDSPNGFWPHLGNVM